MEIALSKSILRPWRVGDSESLSRHANNKKVAQNLREIFPSPYTLADADYFIQKIANSYATQLNFAIEINGEAVGGIGANFMSDVYKLNAEVGYWLSEQYWGQGIITEVLEGFIHYVAAHYNIRRVYAAVFETNLASMRVLEKCGFNREAILRNAVIKNGIFMDEYIYTKWLGEVV